MESIESATQIKRAQKGRFASKQAVAGNLMAGHFYTKPINGSFLKFHAMYGISFTHLPGSEDARGAVFSELSLSPLLDLAPIRPQA